MVTRMHTVCRHVFSGEVATTMTTRVYSLGSLKQRRMDSNRLLFNIIVIVIIIVWFIYCVFVIL
jgi:di/tricarboxylate transporter